MLSLCLVGILLISGPAAGAAQSEGPKKPKAESCDGAADIVPAKAVSFARKRRPTPKTQPADSKPAKTQ